MQCIAFVRAEKGGGVTVIGKETDHTSINMVVEPGSSLTSSWFESHKKKIREYVFTVEGTLYSGVGGTERHAQMVSFTRNKHKKTASSTLGWSSLFCATGGEGTDDDDDDDGASRHLEGVSAAASQSVSSGPSSTTTAGDMMMDLVIGQPVDPLARKRKRDEAGGDKSSPFDNDEDAWLENGAIACPRHADETSLIARADAACHKANQSAWRAGHLSFTPGDILKIDPSADWKLARDAGTVVALFKNGEEQEDDTAEPVLFLRDAYDVARNLVEVWLKIFFSDDLPTGWLDTHGATTAESIERMKLDEDQRKAMDLMIRKRFFIVAGPPGSGKTRTVALYVLLLACKGFKVVVAPMTLEAKAAFQGAVDKCIARFFPDHEIHLGSLVEVNTVKHFTKSRKPLHCDVLIHDEAGTANTLLLSRIVDRVSINGRLQQIGLIGDGRQNSAIAAGDILGDCSALFPFRVAPLFVNHRFVGGSTRLRPRLGRQCETDVDNQSFPTQLVPLSRIFTRLERTPDIDFSINFVPDSKLTTIARALFEVYNAAVAESDPGDTIRILVPSRKLAEAIYAHMEPGAGRVGASDSTVVRQVTAFESLRPGDPVTMTTDINPNGDGSDLFRKGELLVIREIYDCQPNFVLGNNRRYYGEIGGTVAIGRSVGGAAMQPIDHEAEREEEEIMKKKKKKRKELGAQREQEEEEEETKGPMPEPSAGYYPHRRIVFSGNKCLHLSQIMNPRDCMRYAPVSTLSAFQGGELDRAVVYLGGKYDRKAAPLSKEEDHPRRLTRGNICVGMSRARKQTYYVMEKPDVAEIERVLQKPEAPRRGIREIFQQVIRENGHESSFKKETAAWDAGSQEREREKQRRKERNKKRALDEQAARDN